MTSDELAYDANQLLRSAYAIAERKGVNTNWKSFAAKVKNHLEREQAYFCDTTLKSSATATAKTFKLPIIDGIEISEDDLP